MRKRQRPVPVTMIKKTLSFFAVAAFLTASVPATLNAQILSRGDLFGPGATPPLLGLELGLGQHSQMGTFEAECGCTFEDASNSGFMVGGVFELPLSYDWVIGLRAAADFKKTHGTQQVNETSLIRFEQTDDSSTASGSVKFDRIGDISATYLAATPFIKYQFARMGPFVQVGFNLGFLMSSHFTHTRELTSTTAVLEDGSTVRDIRFTNGTLEETLEDGEIKNAKGMRLGAQLTGGYDIQISERSVLAPMFTYEFPISTIRDDAAADWKIGSLFVSVAMKFKLD